MEESFIDWTLRVYQLWWLGYDLPWQLDLCFAVATLALAVLAGYLIYLLWRPVYEEEDYRTSFRRMRGFKE